MAPPDGWVSHMIAAFAPETLRPETIGRRTAMRADASATVATVLLIEGRALVRECLTVACGRNGPQLGSRRLAGICSTPWPRPSSVDLCLVSLGTGGTLERVKASFPPAALVVLERRRRLRHGRAAAAQGARGYFSTAVDLAVLVQGVRLVLMGGTAMPVAVTPPAPARHATRHPRSLALLGRAVHAQGARGAAQPRHRPAEQADRP